MNQARCSARAIAFGALSGRGLEGDAFAIGAVGSPPRVVIERDAEFERAGLARPFAARVPMLSTHADRATSLLARALSDACAGLDAVRPAWRNERIGIAIGTSSGGMQSAERFFAERAKGSVIAPDLARAATYFAPFDAALEEVGLATVARRTQVLAACAASTIALGIALRWLDRDACDVVLAGGYDALTVFVASGFEVLRATSATRPRPFRKGRDGMALGEGAGIVALVRDDRARDAKTFVHVAGFGASTDAVHITAPDRTGAGLARAARAALADTDLEATAIDLVSAHATSTPYNDAMESRAIATALGESAPVIHPFKAEIGHTLGAAGILETLAAADALARGIAPPSAGEGELDPDAPARLLARAEPLDARAALKLSAAFGGTNAALVLTKSPIDRRAVVLRPVFVTASATIVEASLDTLERTTGIARDRLARLDGLCRLGLAAVAELAAVVGRDALAGAGIVAGHALATLETNAAFFARLVARGPTLADPRLFPATSPNAIAGECAIAFRLTGPGFSVGAGLDGGTEALSAAAELVACGDAERMVVVAADDAGPAGAARLAAAEIDRRFASGAVALLVEVSPRALALPVSLDLTADHGASAIGHLALVERFALQRSP